MSEPQIDFSDRNEYVGASEVAAIVGMNPYRTALDVYREKVGETEREDLSDVQAVHFGNVLEETVAQEWSRRNGEAVRRDTKTYTLEGSPLRGHIDRRVTGAKRGLEAKTASIYMSKEFGEQGTDDIPMWYLIQCHSYLMLTGWEKWHLGALIGGNDFRQYEILPNERLMDSLLGQVNTFWDNLKIGVAPPPTTLDDLMALYPEDNGGAVDASLEVVQACMDLQSIKQGLKDMNEQKKNLETLVKKHMGVNALLIDHGGLPAATWKTNNVARIDTKALKAEMPEIADKYTINSTQRRFLVK
jgi:putative phage-type endonuclease